ncbi:MAG: hypothetical protein ACTSRA_00910 [Promethearchaeota archaeon]|nr:MAG: SAM-dependent methyltransferase [Helarchaeota virus Nidhogg Meg22_1012]URC17338.1 MAG: SAM-dependent methyltransferase [Helarchaeota virus Nidhogg Meg22_1214]
MNYQDTWINGKVVSKGIRECNDRYKMIRGICQKYKRPFTLLDIGANSGYFCIRGAIDFPESVFIAVEPTYVDEILLSIKVNKLKNVVVLNDKLTVEKLNALKSCSHFDIALLLSVIHNFDEDIHDVYVASKKLAEHVIYEMAVEKKSLGKKYEENNLIINDLGVPDALIESHVDPLKKRPMYCVKNNIDIKTTRYGTEYDFNGYVISNYEEKIYVSKRKNEERKWIPGINLWTYIQLNGIYPTRGEIVSMIKDVKLEGHHDIRPWNLILGRGIYAIDVNDPSHPVPHGKKEINDLINFILSGKKEWIC